MRGRCFVYLTEKYIWFTHWCLVVFLRSKRKKKSIDTSSEEEAKNDSSSPPKKKLKKKNNRQRILTADSSDDDDDAEAIVILSQHKDVDKVTEEKKIDDGENDLRRPDQYFDENNAQNLSENALPSCSAKPSNAVEKRIENSLNERTDYVTASSTLNTSTSSSIFEPLQRRTIVVASVEVHRANEVISDLKHRFNVDVAVRSGLCVGYVLSPRIGVHRMSVKDFCNGANRAGLVDQCQKMNDLVYLHKCSFLIIFDICGARFKFAK